MNPPAPEAKSWLLISKSFLDSADLLQPHCDQPPNGISIHFPTMFLYFRSIEASLKSFLKAKGVSDDIIKNKIGHRISAAFLKCEEFQLIAICPIDQTDKDFINRYSDFYSRKWTEYTDEWWINVDLDRLALLATKLEYNIYRSLFEGNHPPSFY